MILEEPNDYVLIFKDEKQFVKEHGDPSCIDLSLVKDNMCFIFDTNRTNVKLTSFTSKVLPEM